jgi:endonuclease YncB( thermonuclease family)
MIAKVSLQYGVDPVLVRAVVRQESNWDPRATSNKGARGLMQLMPPTAGDYGVTDPDTLYDPQTNLQTGIQHLKRLLGKYPGDEQMALAAYNAGEGNVRKHGGIPPFKETQDYVKSVLSHKARYQKQMETVAPKAAGMTVKPPAAANMVNMDLFRTPSSEKRYPVGGNPLVGSKEFIDQMMEKGAKPAMMNTPSETRKPTDYETPWLEADKEYKAQYPVVVDTVYDADTIYVHYLHDSEKESFPVRFYDIQAPELWKDEARTIPNPAGVEARDNVKNLVGKRLILNRPIDPKRGKYGRVLGKFYKNKLGHTIDVSKPDVRGIEAPKYTGWVKGPAAGFAADAVDFSEFIMWGADKLLPGEPFKPARDWIAENWGSPTDAVREDFLAGASSDYMVQLPMFGPVSISEMARVGAVSFTELLGVDLLFGGLGKGSKAVQALAKAADASHAADITKFKHAVSIIDSLNEGAEVQKALNAASGKYMKTLHPDEEHMTVMQSIAGYWDRFLYHFSEKERGITKIARALGDESLMELVARNRDTIDIAQSPLFLGTGYWDADLGKWVDTFSPSGLSSLTDIINGLPKGVAHEAMQYMVAQREVLDLAPRWAAALQKSREALHRSKRKGKPKPGTDKWNERVEAGARKELGWSRSLDDDAVQWAEDVMELTELKYHGHSEEAWKQFGQLTDELRQFMDRAILEPLEKIGVLDGTQLKALRETGKHYVPYMRAIRETVEKIGGPEAVEAMLKIEQDAHEASMKGLRGGGEFQHARVLPEGKPIKAARGGGLQLDAPIGDPLQALVIRVQSLHKFVSAQMVRNQLADLITKNPGKVEHSLIEIPKLLAQYKKAAPTNLMVAWKGGKEIGYVFRDKTLAQSIAGLSSSQMGLLQKIIENPAGKILTFPTKLFRTGVVMGLEFMSRNPGRDQFTAALMSRYGYIPGWDFMKGLYQTITKGTDWEDFHKSGAGMANFNSLDIHAAEIDLSNVMQQKTYAQLRREIRMGTFEGTPRARDYAKALGNSIIAAGRKAGTAAGITKPTGNFLQRTAQRIEKGTQATLYGLGRISEIAEESTRVGNFMRAKARAAKGKGYGWLYSLDKAAGGIRTPWNYFKPSVWKQARKYVNTPTRMGQWMADTREVSLDFSRRGYTGEVLNSLYAFANAEFQDTARFARAMMEAPLNTVIKGFSLLSVPAIANWYLNFDDPRHQQMNEAERALFLHPFGYDENYQKFGRLSRPIGIPGTLFSYGVEKMLDEMYYRNPEGIKALEEIMWPGVSDAREIRNLFQEKAYDITGQMSDLQNTGLMLSTAPLGMVGLLRRAGRPGEKADPTGPPDHRQEFANVAGQTGPGRWFNDPLNWAPQAIQPFMEVSANRDAFFGGTIVPTREIMRPRAPEDTKTGFTSPIEEQVAAAFRTTGNFLPWEVDWLRDMNPIQAGFLMRRYTGSIGNMALASLDYLGQRAGMMEDRPGLPKNLGRAPLVKGFYGRSPWGPNSQPTIDFYERYDEAMVALNTVQDRLKGKDAQGAADYIADQPGIAAAKFMRAVAGEVSEVWKERRAVLDDRTISDETREDRIQALDQYVTQQLIIANDIYDSIKEEFDQWLH